MLPLVSDESALDKDDPTDDAEVPLPLEAGPREPPPLVPPEPNGSPEYVGSEPSGPRSELVDVPPSAPPEKSVFPWSVDADAAPPRGSCPSPRAARSIV